MKRIWKALTAALLIACIVATGALADSIDVEPTVPELDEFVIGDSDGLSPDESEIEGAPETDSDLSEAEAAYPEIQFVDDDALPADGGAGDGIGAVEATDEQAVLAAMPCSVTNAEHTPVIDPAVAPTFDQDGLTEGSHCADCGVVLVPQSIIPKRQYWQLTMPNAGKYKPVQLIQNDCLLLIPNFATSAGLSVTGFKSSKPKVATVDGNGWITAVSEGKAKITVTTTDKKRKATVTVQVVDPYKPKGISITNGKSASLGLRQSLQLYTSLNPSSARASLTWTSSKPDVVSVSASGLITGLKEGSAKVTVRTHNGKKASIKVKVDGIVVNPNVHYRALLIGEAEFPGGRGADMPSRQSIAMLEKALNSVRGAQGNYWSVTTRINRTDSQIQSDIQSAFYGATDNDISLFFICTHGNESISYGQDYYNAGCLTTYPDAYGRSALSLHRLARWLNAVPGKVIVWIDCCGSGAAIYGAKGMGQSFDPVAFNQSAVEAFSSLDQGVLAPGDRDLGAFVVTNKFYVLTASGYMETSWHLIDKYHYFVKWICDGIKTKGKMPADSNKNRFLTLDELFRYTAARAEKTWIKSNADGRKYKQHVQVYPANCWLELFYSK